MDMQAIFDNYRRTVTEHYFDMHGRVGRAQFWYFMLAVFVGAILVSILQTLTFLPLLAIYDLAMLLPVAGMGARRLQDIGRDGKMVWIFVFAGFISLFLWMIAAISFFALGFLSFLLFGPLIGLLHLALTIACLVLIYFWCQPGTPGDNAYGPPPPVFDPSVRVSAP
jgi:uncharacterized membrane protein YhaH (DUF805 family)